MTWTSVRHAKFPANQYGLQSNKRNLRIAPLVWELEPFAWWPGPWSKNCCAPLWPSRSLRELSGELPQVTLSRAKQKFCESNQDAFRNASRFLSGLDCGPSALRAAVPKAGVARPVWRVRKLPPVMVSDAVKEFYQSDQQWCRNRSSLSNLAASTSISVQQTK